MKTLVLIFTAFCIFSCNTENSKTEEQVMQTMPAIYKTPNCPNEGDLEAQNQCAEAQMRKEVMEIINSVKVPKEEITSTKLIVEISISEEGKPSVVKTVEGVNREIDSAVNRYLAKQTWYPAQHDGVKMKASKRIPFYLE